LKTFTKVLLRMIPGRHYNLIEAVADDVARVALSLPRCTAVEVIVFGRPGA
jgi:hypothetical protein